MKIVMHSLYFPPQVGGLETHVLTLAQALQRRGHEVYIVTANTVKGSPSYEEYEGVPVYRIFCPNRALFGWVLSSILSIPRMLKLGKDADILHLHTFPSVVPALPLIWFYKKPSVATMHTSHFLRLAKKKFWKKILAFLLRQPDIILAPSIEIKDVSLELAKNIEAYALVNAVDVERFKLTNPKISKKDDEKIIAVPRRLFIKNGVEYAIKALPLIRKKVNAKLYLLGDGPEREKLFNLAKELDIEEHVFFMGNIPNSDMPGYISSADVILIPSLLEATSIAALESMACQKVICASNIGGLPEIITNEYGRLSNPADSDDIAKKVLELLELPEDERKKMGEKARKVVLDGWTTDKLAEQIEQYYLKAIKYHQ